MSYFTTFLRTRVSNYSMETKTVMNVIFILLGMSQSLIANISLCLPPVIASLYLNMSDFCVQYAQTIIIFWCFGEG